MAFVFLLLYVLILFLRPQEWNNSPIYGWPIVDFAAGATLLFAITSLRNVNLRRPLQNPLVIGLFVGALMSHVAQTYYFMFKYTFREFGKILLLYGLIVLLVTSVRRVKLLIFILIIGCLFLSYHGILQAHTGFGVGGKPPMIVPHTGEMRVEAYGFFGDPNDLALMLVVILPFLLSKVFTRASVLPARMLSLGAAVPALYCIFLTKSRGGWLALGAMIVAYVYLHLPKKFGIVLGLILFAIVLSLGPARMGTINTQDGRMELWSEGLTMFKTSPVSVFFGIGMYRYADIADSGQVAHNSFIHCFTELGLFGYFFWLGLILACVKDGWALGKLESDDPDVQEISRLSRASLAALGGYLAAGFFLSRTYIAPLYILFAIFTVLRSIYERDHAPLESGFDWRHLKFVPLFEVGSIGMMYLILRVLWRL